MSRETNMTVGRPTKLILGLAVPLILTNVGQQLYTVADASIVGRGVGVEALAALGATATPKPYPRRWAKIQKAPL